MTTDQRGQDLVGQMVGKYHVEQLLSSVPGTTVYLAHQQEEEMSAATIAMYFLPSTLSHSAHCRFRQRFSQVASTLVTLHHPNLLPLYDYGEHEDNPYLVAHFSTARPLALQIKQCPCTPEFTLHILKQVADALDYAHSRGRLHRALSSRHILHDQHTIQVAGLGLVDLLAREGIEPYDHPLAHLLTVTETFLGTPEAIAPECVQNYPADARADVYGLGILLFELLNGKPPWRGTDPFEVAGQHVHSSIPSLHDCRPDLPAALDQVIGRALARNPVYRYQRVSDLVAAYAQVLEDGGTQYQAVGSPETHTASSPHSLDNQEKTHLVEQEPAIPSMTTKQLEGGLPPEAFATTSPRQVPVAMHNPQEEVSLFDIRFLGQDSFQYHVRASVRGTHDPQAPPTLQRLPMQREQRGILAQGPLSTYGQHQSQEMIDFLPAASTETVHDDDTARNFLLRVVQPGLAGLMDGSVSTLAPIFATAFATHQPFTAFLVGMASALGAGISMAFAEALSDDGEITGRGSPLLRGSIVGLMTFLSGAGHTLPFLIADLHLALLFAYVVVGLELIAIAAIRHRFFHTSWWLSIIQVVGGGILVFAAALLLGNA